MHPPAPDDPLLSAFDEASRAALHDAAARRRMTVEQLVVAAVRAYMVPHTDHATEAEALGEHVVQPPLERLAPPLRAAVRIAGAGVRLLWLAAGRGRYRIGPGLLTNGRLRLGGPGRITVGRDVNAWARSTANHLRTFRPEAVIVVGDRVRLNGAGIQAATRVEIGDDAILGSCTIVDTDHHSVDPRRRDTTAAASRPIRIGSRVWIGGAVVLKGVNVGDNSVIGLGSVVTEDVPPNVVMAGNPARVVRRFADPPPAER